VGLIPSRSTTAYACGTWSIFLYPYMCTLNLCECMCMCVCVCVCVWEYTNVISSGRRPNLTFKICPMIRNFVSLFIQYNNSNACNNIHTHTHTDIRINIIYTYGNVHARIHTYRRACIAIYTNKLHFARWIYYARVALCKI
jgi:hypothetical protein